MNGSFTVESTADEGTRILVTVPLVAISNGDGSPAHQGRLGSPTRELSTVE